MTTAAAMEGLEALAGFIFKDGFSAVPADIKFHLEQVRAALTHPTAPEVEEAVEYLLREWRGLTPRGEIHLRTIITAATQKGK